MRLLRKQVRSDLVIQDTHRPSSYRLLGLLECGPLAGVKVAFRDDKILGNPLEKTRRPLVFTRSSACMRLVCASTHLSDVLHMYNG